MANSSFADVSLGDIADFRNGKAISPEKYTAGGKHPVFGSNGQIARSNEVLYPDPAIVIGRVGAYCGCVHYVSRASWVTDNAIVALPKDGNDIRYLFYLLGSLELQRTAIGSAQPLMTQGGLKVVRTKAPPLTEQKAIAAVLGALDDKIELNRRMNATLEAMARALFQSWFIDFDPVRANLDRNQPSPQPSPTGRGSKDREKAELPSPLGRRAGDEGAFGFLDGRQPVGLDPATAALIPAHFDLKAEGVVPTGWRGTTLGEVIEISDSKRTPLSGREREARKGKYPYHGAASVMDYVDDFIFDGIYALMGEDGSVINEDGTPVLQYVWGKFWVNNHAHVLRGKNGISTEHLLLHLKGCNIAPFVNGAVQPKLNQGNMNRIPFMLPPPEIGQAFAKTIEPLFAQIRANTEQSRTLATLRGKNPESDLLRANDTDFLKGLGAMRAGQVTHTGLLLFGQAEVIAAHCPQAQVHYVHQPSDTAAARNDQWRVGLLLALERIEQTFSGPANPEEELSVGLFKLRVPAFPLDSVREAVLNALTHRNYADPGEVLIRHTKREVVVTSPGGFVGGITVENFLRHEPVARNRTLADALVRLRLVEAAGMGRRRMWVQALSLGKPAPRPESDGHLVTLRLFNTGCDTAMAGLVSRLNHEGQDIGLDTLLVLSQLREHPYMDADTAARLLRVDVDEARRLLDELGPSGLGVLERKSHTRSATFHLTKGIARELLGKAAYTKTRGLNPIRYAEMVREYLHDHPSISNREVRELLGLGESPTAQVEASRYLKKWSGLSGFLTAEGNGAKRCYRLKETS